MEQPKHDAESLALEEQFGIPSVSLDFGQEGRAVLTFDARPIHRAFAAASAQMEQFGAAVRRGASRPTSISEAANMTQAEVDGLIDEIEDLHGD